MVGLWLWELLATQKLFYLKFYWYDFLKFHHRKTAQTGTPHSLVKCDECFIKREVIFILLNRDFAITWTWARTSLFSLFLPGQVRRTAGAKQLLFQTPSYKSINKPWILWTTGIYLQGTAANIGLLTTNTMERLVEPISHQTRHAHNEIIIRKGPVTWYQTQ